MALENGTCDHDLRKEIKILVKNLILLSIVVFNMVKLLGTLQVKAGKAMIKESYSSR